MTDMFIPKKEKIIIIVEAAIYVLLILLASYFTICGNLIIRMVPMIYFLGIFGIVLFKKPIVTVILNLITTIVFGILAEQEINLSVCVFCLYSSFMLICGEVTGYILNLFYENYRLRKFVKHYTKIIYIFVLLACALIPLFLNNIVNSNFVSYIRSKNEVDKYINENYVYSHYYIDSINYEYGKYEFKAIVDGIDVDINYTLDGNIADINVEKRKESLNKIANSEINMMLKDNNLTYLDVECMYDYSRLATVPDVIRLTIYNVNKDKLHDIVNFIDVIKKWNKYFLIDRIDISVDDVNVSITKKDLQAKDITEEYILNGMKYEMLGSKEGI